MPSHMETVRFFHRDAVQHDLLLAAFVQKSQRPNVVGCRIQLKSSWNFELLETLVTETRDREAIQYLKFGWPINYLKTQDPTPTFKNHSGATDFPDTIDEYIQRELGEGRLIGPVATPAFDQRSTTSPMTTRPKRESTRRRVICDLSWPLGRSVNDGIPQDSYMYVPAIQDNLPNSRWHLQQGQATTTATCADLPKGFGPCLPSTDSVPA